MEMMLPLRYKTLSTYKNIDDILYKAQTRKYYKNGEYIDTALWAIIVGDRLY